MLHHLVGFPLGVSCWNLVKIFKLPFVLYVKPFSGMIYKKVAFYLLQLASARNNIQQQASSLLYISTSNQHAARLLILFIGMLLECFFILHYFFLSQPTSPRNFQHHENQPYKYSHCILSGGRYTILITRLLLKMMTKLL